MLIHNKNSKKKYQKRLIIQDTNEKILMFRSVLFASANRIPQLHQLKMEGGK